jgi:DeoR family suf operon transcriptional repressor
MAQTSTKQDILVHLLRRGQATAQDLAELLQVTPQAIRRHLKDLEQEELIQHVVRGGEHGAAPTPLHPQPQGAGSISQPV